jgi:addiction module RelE/StbE family toxin
MYAVDYSESAQGDLLSIIEYISENSPRRAREFVGELRARIEDRLGSFPKSGVVIGRHRYTVFGNYVVVYEVDDASDKVLIVLITEGHRNWRPAFE